MQGGAERSSVGGFVADSSLAVAWVVKSQASPDTERLLDNVESGHVFAVPVLWAFEVANGLLTLKRRKRITAQERDQAHIELSTLNPLYDEDGPHLALGRITELAEKHSLTVYDATYLELAVRRGLPIASRDAALNQAAHRAGVETLL